jgi:alanine racemase
MSTNLEARAWIQVRAGALRRNFARIREAVAPDVRILPMVKANAYGLGMREVVHQLEPLAPWGFGVATVEEGRALRDLGVTRPIVVCSPTPEAALDVAVRNDLQLSISSLRALNRLSEEARRAGGIASYHVDVDTGMGRSGFDWRDVEGWMPEVSRPDPSLRWVGVITHMHSADEGAATIHEQWRRLEEVLEHVEQPPDGLMIHALNSAGIFRTPSYARAVVRPGIFLYGGTVGAGQPTPEPVASIHARVVHTRDARPGTTLGYGATYTASATERWATLSIGYGDGLPRALGNRGQAIVGGVRVPIIGRISMDVTVVDITGVPSVDVGTVATLMGPDGDEGITVDEIAEQAGTISYEVLTGLTARLPRVWSGCEDVSATASASGAIA